MTSRPLVRIRYLRPPDREEIFTQRLLLDDSEVKVTLAEQVTFDPPIRIHGKVVLETGSDAVWFTFPGRWHDIGRFHRADGTLTGIYANILTPPVFESDEVWQTTDLFLDVWMTPRGELWVLDEEQLEEALSRGWLSATTAERARREVEWIKERHRSGAWPPSVVEAWTLQRAREVARGDPPTGARRARSVKSPGEAPVSPPPAPRRQPGAPGPDKPASGRSDPPGDRR